MESDRLDEELNLLHHNRPPPGEWYRPEDTQKVPLPTSSYQPAQAIHRDTDHIPTQSDRTNNPQPPMQDVPGRLLEQHIEVKFWSLERGQWNLSDCLLIDRSDPSPIERVARKYSSKNYALYDVNLHSLRPDHCYRAATADGSNAIFLISAHEENQLAVDGRFGKEKQTDFNGFTSCSWGSDKMKQP